MLKRTNNGPRPEEHASAACMRLEGRPQILIQFIKQSEANMCHRPVQTGAGTPLVQLTSTSITTPRKGGSSAPRGRFGTNFRDCKTRTRIQFGSGVRTASRRTVAGTFRRCFSEICTELSRWASPMQLVPYFAPPPRPLGLVGATPAFPALARVGRPPVAPSLLPKVISDKKPTSSGPAFSLRFKLVIRKRSL